MFEFSSDVFLWIKAFHIISVIAWMAALLYLPRLFVYHCDAEKGSEFSEKLKIMERRLVKIIMNPARLASLFFGILLFLNLDDSWWHEYWLLLKICLVLFLFGIHDMLNKWRKSFETDQNKYSQKFYRLINEVPTLLMVIIVILAVIKPF